MSAKNIAVRRPSLLDRVLECAGDVLLPDHIGKLLGTVFTSEDLVAHGKEITRLYVMNNVAFSVKNPRFHPCRTRLLGLPFCWLDLGDSMQLKLNERKLSDGIVVLDCAGRLVFGEETSVLRDKVKSLVNPGARIVLSLADVTYIDSGGLGTLVALYTTAKNADASIKLARLTKRVGDLLQVTKLLTVFDVYDSEEEAVNSFRKGAAA
jgi:anti-sigma B factor antagonist